MSEQTIAIVSFTGALKREIVKLQKKIAKCEQINYIDIRVKASGRAQSGDIKITYSICGNEYQSDVVEGNDLDALCEEFLRRHGWTQRNAPLMLTVNEQRRADSDRVVTNDAEESKDDLEF